MVMAHFKFHVTVPIRYPATHNVGRHTGGGRVERRDAQKLVSACVGMIVFW